MQIDLVPTLIDQFRETFEGEVNRMCWITDGTPQSAIFGTLTPLSAEQAFTAPSPGARSIAAHVQHLRYALDLTAQRLQGADPPADWMSSFNVPPVSAKAWETLQSELRRAYESVVEIFQQSRSTPVEKWPPIQVAGLAAMTAHNAYHLGAIRQMIKILSGQSAAAAE